MPFNRPSNLSTSPSEISGEPTFRIFEAFEEAETLWRAIEDAGDAYIYQTYDWLLSWHRLVGAKERSELCLTAVLDDAGQPLLFLPLAIERRRLWSVLTWLGSPFSDYNAPLLAPDAALRLERVGGVARIWRLLKKRLPAFDYADFERLPADIGGQSNPLSQLASIGNAYTAYNTRLSGDWPTYYAGKRSKKTRHNDRRKRRKLESQGQLQFEIPRTSEEIDLMVSAMLRQKRAYVNALRKKNILDEPGYHAFLCSRAEEGLKTGETILCGLTLDQKILAVQWGAIRDKRLYSIIASYDYGEHSSLSPGEILLHELFGWCFDQGIDVFDFTFGDEPYKRAWCEQTLDLCRSVMPASAWGHLGASAIMLGIKAKHQLKGSAYAQKWLTKPRYLFS